MERLTFVLTILFLRNRRWQKTSVTRLGDLLHFSQPFKAFGNNKFAQISYILKQFL